ncbi:hypothetical protein H5410_055596 [Solanum commersonii]|uniref:Uncharacterized protein n=1 Tax=Solanum commersonii TaxID=4109 RepID=A0A9J5WKQ4_SOLCO|nr:hypothetical protein H5410_055596 [Solanum commersonii]
MASLFAVPLLPCVLFPNMTSLIFVMTPWRTKDTCKCSIGEFLVCSEGNLEISRRLLNSSTMWVRNLSARGLRCELDDDCISLTAAEAALMFSCSVQEMMDQTLHFPISLLVERMDKFALCCWLKIPQQVLGAVLPVTGFLAYKLLES